jgi:hypothetical protein
MKLSVFCGVSVDGFLARPDDTFDFLQAGEQQPHGFNEFLASQGPGRWPGQSAKELGLTAAMVAVFYRATK